MRSGKGFTTARIKQQSMHYYRVMRILTFILLLLIAVPVGRAVPANNGEKITVEMIWLSMSFDLKTMAVRLALEYENKQSITSQPLHDFSVMVVAPQLYHVRYKTWKGVFWKIDTKSRRLYRVTNGSFGSLGGSEEIIKDCQPTENTAPSFSVPSAPGEQPKQELVTYIRVILPHSSLTYDSKDDSVEFTVEGDALSVRRDWDVK